MISNKIAFKSMLWIFLSIVITACGGGGGGGSGSGDTDTDIEEEVVVRDVVPDSFEFTAGEAVELNAVRHSNPITVSGINVATVIQIEGGEFSVDGGDFTSEEGTVVNGQEVIVRHTTSSLNSTTTETVLTIGGVSGSYLTTTLAYDGQLVIVSSGADLVLMGMNNEGELMERSRDTYLSNLADYSTNFVIFSVTKHPSANLVFVTSMNECGTNALASDGCWGNARIDRFAYDANTISYDGVAFLAQGPLRFSIPSFDEVSSELSMILRNQGKDPISIVQLTANDLTMESTVETTCNSVELESGDTCALTITAGDGVQATATIEIETSIANFSTEIFYSEDLEAYAALGLSTSDRLDGLPQCATDNFSEYYQLGGCALTAMAISADGTRAYVNDDGSDRALILALDESGAMTFINEDARVGLQGIAVNADNTALYNGSNVYEIVDDVVTQVTFGSGGNATEVVSDLDGRDLLVSIIDNSSLNISELDTDPLNPIQISSATPSLNARFQAHSEDLGVFVTTNFSSSQSSLTVYLFDDEILTESGNLNTTTEFDDCDACDYGVYPRKVQLTKDGAFAVTSVFVNAFNVDTVNQVPYLGAAVAYRIDTDTEAGTSEITEVDRLTFDGMARALLFVNTP